MLRWRRLCLVQLGNVVLLRSLEDGSRWHWRRRMLLNHLRIGLLLRLRLLQRYLLISSLGLRLRGHRDRLRGKLREARGLLLLGHWQKRTLVTLRSLGRADHLIPLVVVLSESLLLLVWLILRMRVLRGLMLHCLLLYLRWLLHMM